MQKYIVWITIAFVLVGCFGDPLAFTQRTQIRANADVAIAQAERDAVVGAAEAEASKSQAWAMVAVPLAIVIMGGLAVIVIVYWQGKIYHDRMATYRSRQITVSSQQDLVRYAKQIGGRLAIDDQGYKVYLPNGQVRRLLPVDEQR